MKTFLLILTLIQSVTLRGTVFEADKPIAGAMVTVVGDDGTLQTTSDSDGKFTFTLPKIGSFELSAKRGNSSSRLSTMFVGQNMEGIGIVLLPLSKPLTGSVTVEGSEALPAPRPKIVIQYASGNVANRCDITENGLFFCQHPAEFRVSLEGLPDSYFVKKMMLGDLDLIKTPTIVNNESLTHSLIITIALRK